MDWNRVSSMLGGRDYVKGISLPVRKSPCYRVGLSSRIRGAAHSVAFIPLAFGTAQYPSEPGTIGKQLDI